MKKVFLVVLVAALAFTCTTAFAAGNNIEKGTSEFAVFLGVNESEGSTKGSQTKSISDSMNLNLNYGVFLVGGLQLGVSYMADQSKSWTETNGNKVANTESTTEMSFLFLDLKYNFVFSKSQTVVPYIGVGVGSASTKTESGGTTYKGSGTATKVGGGLKFFMTENTSLNVELRRESFTYKLSGSTVDSTTDTTGINFGMSVYF
jgi:outer membrane protein W